MPSIFEIRGPELQSSEDFPTPLNLRTIPPMIVFEKGESLEEFAKRRAPDFIVAIQVWDSLGLTAQCSKYSEAGVMMKVTGLLPRVY
jgi:hypothetical protein